jgi:hypothetical protein
MRPGRTPLDVTQEPLKVQMETFLDEHRAALHACLDGLTEEQARRSLVPSLTTLLGLVKHATYAEKVWFGEAVTGRPRAEMGMPPRRVRRPAGPRPASAWMTSCGGTTWDRCPCGGCICTPCVNSPSTAATRTSSGSRS